MIPGVASRARPGVVHNVRTLGGVTARRQDPLRTGGQRCAAATERRASFAGDPFGPGRHSDLVARAVVAHHGAHHVSPVPDVVARRAPASSRRIGPVGRVIERASSQGFPCIGLPGPDGCTGRRCRCWRPQCPPPCCRTCSTPGPRRSSRCSIPRTEGRLPTPAAVRCCTSPRE